MTVEAALDDDPARCGGFALDAPILSEADAPPGPVTVAVGDNAARRALRARLEARGWTPATVIHPRACVAPSARIGPGAFVAALAVVGPQAVIGADAIVNHGAVVDHDCVVGDGAHVAPNATLGGGCRVGEGATVGAGATLLPGRRVGAWAVLGAGAVATRDVPDGAVATGAPARLRDTERTP
jgi:acetyltransferase EpsM